MTFQCSNSKKTKILCLICRKRGPFLSAVQPGSMSNWLDDEPRSLLRAMSMTVCDLSAITKPWEIEKRVAELVSSEFFEQGDMERQELKITPIVRIHFYWVVVGGFCLNPKTKIYYRTLWTVKRKINFRWCKLASSIRFVYRYMRWVDQYNIQMAVRCLIQHFSLSS